MINLQNEHFLGYNPSDFFGPSATSGLDTGLDDFTGFGDMTFDSDALLNFGGMQPYSGDLGKWSSVGQFEQNSLIFLFVFISSFS